MTCDLHKIVYRTECSECCHMKMRAEETAKKQANALAIKLLKSKEVKPRKSIKKVSEKRKETNHEYFKLVEQFKHDNPKCIVRLGGCTETTDDPHHKRGRGKYLLDVSTWLPVCRNCHIYIENHPDEAKEKGWSESRLAIDQTKPTI